jgi:excisionase family DNA binding protein
MKQNTLSLNTPTLLQFINEVFPKHRDYFLQQNENATELDCLESLNEIYSEELGDYIRIKGMGYFDDEIYKNKRIIEYLRKQIVEFKTNNLTSNSDNLITVHNNSERIDLNKKVLTLEEAAILLGLSKSYLYKLTSRGVLEYSKPNGKTIFIEKEYLENWMLSGKQKTRMDIEKEAMSYCTKSKKKGGNHEKCTK